MMNKVFTTIFSAVWGTLRGLLVTLLVGSLEAYKLFISPWLGNRCRFHPTCSAYARQSIEQLGPVRGSWLALCRLVKCGPWHSGGIDEVPQRHQASVCCEHSLASATNAVNRTSA